MRFWRSLLGGRSCGFLLLVCTSLDMLSKRTTCCKRQWPTPPNSGQKLLTIQAPPAPAGHGGMRPDHPSSIGPMW
jgi:hypothetical protein